MYFEAQFFFNGVKVSSRMIDMPYPPHTIRESAHVPLEAISFLGEMPGPNAVLDLHYWVYTFKEQNGQNSFRYDFDGEESEVKFAKVEGLSWDIGFPDTEPDENVNLDKLTAKLRDNKKVRQMLLRYYAA